jgi:hypothetical protein
VLHHHHKYRHVFSKIVWLLAGTTKALANQATACGLKFLSNACNKKIACSLVVNRQQAASCW